jgi:sigma-B regulation protein RsbU (phosphoserine phosphatase)
MEAGGDFYEVLKIGPSTFGYFVADVCGHDLGASYATSALKVLMSEEIASSGVPGDVMRRMNTALGSVLTEGKYITACYARLDRSRSELTVVNAGHPPPIYVGRDGAARRMEGRGDILGVFEKVSFGAERISTSPGDRFFLYTDGFIEGFISRKMSRDEGLTALLEACSKTLGLPVGDAVKEVRMALYPDSGDVEDDLLLLGVDL